MPRLLSAQPDGTEGIMLTITNFSKTYAGGKKAVDNLSLTVNAGEIMGFIGHNGAGKTTTLRAVAGILDFTEGEIVIDGHSVKDEPVAAKQVTAFLPDNPDLYEFLTGIKYLAFIADIYGISKDVREERIRKYADAFELTGALGSPIGGYSHGMKQKLAVISALIRAPRLLILDEPFVGLDPQAAFVLKGFLREICAAGGAVFFSTHVLEVAEKLCDRIAIIKGGRLVKMGTTASVVGDESLEQVFLELAQEGVIDGVERYHPRVKATDIPAIEQVASRYDLIVTGGTIDIAFAKDFLSQRSYDYVIAADAGLEVLRPLHISPNAVVGDLDTVDKKVLEEYQNQPDIEFEIHKPEKDETDTELALLTAARQGCEAVDILGALGGRMDHAIGNIQLMYQFFCQGMEVNIYDARNRLYLLGGHKVFHREEVYGKYISFLPMTETVEGLTLRGFKYPLQRRTIGLGTSLCISNELKREEGILELERGVLLCVEAHD